MKKILALACALSLSACATTSADETGASGGGFMEGVGYAVADRLFDSMFASKSEARNPRQKRGWVHTSVSSPR